MSNLVYYKDNILSKIKQNEELNKILNWIESNKNKENDIILKNGKFSSKLKVDKNILIKTIEEMKKNNEEHIERYLALSFDEDYWKHKIERRNNNDNDSNS